MTTRRWLIPAALGLLAWAGIGQGEVQAQICPASLSGTPLSVTTDCTSGVTISLSPADWSPSPGNSVTITVSGAGATPIISLVCPDGTTTTTSCATPAAAYNPVAAGQLRSSALQGVCTNSGSATDFSVDFTLSAGASATSKVLNSLDCGGMAVIRVTGTGLAAEPFNFLPLPDSDFDGMPNFWEALYCPTGPTQNTCLAKDEDNDTGLGTLVGDGIRAFDEYRGFKVSGSYIRTNPRQKVGTAEKQKDLFLSIVNPAESSATSLLTTTAGILIEFAPLASGDGAVDLFRNIKNLIAAGQVHVLCFTAGAINTGPCDEWVDRFISLAILPPPANALPGTPGTPQFTYCTGELPCATTTTTAPSADRQINKNAVYSPGIRKGLRISESVDATSDLPLGECGVAPVTDPNECILYTQRIVNDTNTKITAGGTRRIKYFTYEGGKWVLKHTGSAAPTDAEKNFLRARHIQFILGHEGAHGADLTAVFSDTYGNHNPENAGDNVDVRIMHVRDNSGSGYNKFYIPKLYNTSNQSCFQLFFNPCP